jgi:hypothetical protein
MLKNNLTFKLYIDTRWHSWLRHCTTSRKVAGSILDGVVGIFHLHNPSGRTLALGSTQPVTEMSTRNISFGGKGDRCVGLTTLPHSSAICLKSGSLNLLEPSGPVQACNGIALPLLLNCICHHRFARAALLEQAECDK